MRKTTVFLFLMACMACAPIRAAAQLSEPEAPRTAAETAPEWNPLQANKDMEIGTFYFKKGNYNAAIDRFTEAAKLHPGLARPYLMLGETYEKTKDLPMAAASYRKYLETYPDAPDGKSVRKRIEGLEKQIARAPGRPAAK